MSFRSDRVLIALAAVGLLGSHSGAAWAGQQCVPSTVVNGVDLNPDGSSPDWVAAQGDGATFGIIKATQGTSYTDSSFATSWAAMKSAGVVRGAYHFFDATVSGVDQANFFLSVMGTLDPGDLPPTLDIECPTSNDEPDSDDCLGNGTSGDATAATITQEMNAFLTTVQAATGRVPIVYSYGSWFSDNNVDTTGLQNYPLWIADYSGTSCFNVPAPWTSATIWQYGDSGNVSGIGSTDVDYFLGSMSQLTVFTSATASTDAGTDASTPAGPFIPPSQVNGNDAFSVVNWTDGHIEVYATGTSGTGYRVDTSVSGTAPLDTWGTPVALGGTASCGVASVYWAGGSGHTSEVFDGLPNGTTESLEYVSSSSSWTSFASFGGVGLNHLSTVAYPDGHVEVFALGDDGTIWHDVSTESAWGGWETLGAASAAFATGAGPILWPDGHAQIFATDAKGGIWQNASNTSSPPVWSGWKAMTGATLASRPIPALWADGHVQVFGRGTDDELYTSDSTGGTFGAWTALNPTQTIQGEPSVLVYSDYGPEIFARDSSSGDLIHMWNSTGTWSAWADDFGQVLASDPMAWLRPDGLGEVFGVDGSGNAIKSLHSGAEWASFDVIASGIDTCIGGTKLVDAGVPVASTDGGLLGVDGGMAVTGADASYAVEGGPEVVDVGPSNGCSCRAARGSNDANDGAKLAVVGLLAIAVLRRKQASKPRCQDMSP